SSVVAPLMMFRAGIMSGDVVLPCCCTLTVSDVPEAAHANTVAGLIRTSVIRQFAGTTANGTSCVKEAPVNWVYASTSLAQDMPATGMFSVPVPTIEPDRVMSLVVTGPDNPANDPLELYCIWPELPPGDPPAAIATAACAVTRPLPFVVT